MDRLLETVASTAERYAMFSPGQRVGVAVSGGADSVCLLLALRELAPRLGIGLSVLHLNHGLRGAESDADADFVRDLAARYSLPYFPARADLSADPGNLEQNARRARLEFFSRLIATGAVRRVATGHTRSDQAETVLFRLIRGAAGAGLAGIRPVVEPGIVRPLLDVSRAEVEAFLVHRGIAWRQDSTNRSVAFARNRIRHQLLPQLARDWNPSISDTLAQTADWALAEETWWETETARLAESLFVHRDGALILEIDPLRALPLAAARRLVRRAIETVKGDLRGVDFQHAAQVLAIAHSPSGHGAARFPGVRVLRSFDWLRFDSGAPITVPDYALPVSVPGILQISGGYPQIHLELIDNLETPLPSQYVYNREMGCVDWPRVSGPLELRNWRPGDRYHPIGHTGEVKIKNLFQEAKIPLWERKGWPVLTDRAGIVWTRRFGPAASLIPDTASRTVLRIRENVKLESETPVAASIKLG